MGQIPRSTESILVIMHSLMLSFLSLDQLLLVCTVVPAYTVRILCCYVIVLAFMV